MTPQKRRAMLIKKKKKKKNLESNSRTMHGPENLEINGIQPYAKSTWEVIQTGRK
jgi:hypothetical protein